MGERQNSRIDSWLDCIFGGPTHNSNCSDCKFRLCIVSAAFVLLAAAITFGMDYLIF